MPKHKLPACILGAKYIEFIHDELVAKLWPDSDPIVSGEYRSEELLESAAARPFHSAFEQDAYPSVIEKAAALFHSLISNHPFHNGNKRTAVLAVGVFLVVNGHFVLLSNARMYQLAEQTASYRQRGLSHADSLREILMVLQDSVVPLAAIGKEAKKDQQLMNTYKAIKRARLRIRRSKLNTLVNPN